VVRAESHAWQCGLLNICHIPYKLVRRIPYPAVTGFRDRNQDKCHLVISIGLDDYGVEAMFKPESFPIDKIYVPEVRRKALNGEVVQEIAASILEIGQQAPILVRPHKDRFVLVEGLHRLEACKALGERAIIGLLVSAEAARQKPLASDVGEAERQKMERLRKLRLEKEAAEKLANTSRAVLETETATRQRERPAKTIRGNLKATSKQSDRERPRTLSDWIKKERDGGRY
jgi:hypothetical protein